ncbi:MAG: hypothetical protein ACT4NX_08355 [Deltaproteobacteria bacterium]
MKPTRRNFIKTVAYGIAATEIAVSLPVSVFAKPAAYDNGIEIEKGFRVLNADTQKTMEALADAIVPGAKKTGIHPLLMGYFSKDPGFSLAGFVDAGLWNLDTVSKTYFKTPFYDLVKREDRKQAVEHIIKGNTVFFLNFREIVVKLHYTNPLVWKTLSFSGPPQPQGYMDYASPPAKRPKK